MITTLLCWWIGCTHPTPPTPSPVAASPKMDAVYLIMVDRFANGSTDNDDNTDLSDPKAFHGGDLEGIRQRLDHIQQLGFDTIWLTPVTRMRTEPIGEHGAFHGYWVQDGNQVESRFGTEADLIGLRNELHKRGMGLLLDLVLNHTEPDSSLLQEKPDWFHHEGDITDWSHPVQLRTHDVHGLPDLAQEKPEVAAHLREQGLGWIERVGPAGFRLDAVRHVDPGFLAEYTAAMRSAGGPHFTLLGEIFDGNPVAVARLARETGLSHVFDFPLHHALVEGICGDGDLRKIAAVMTQDRRYDDPHHLVTFLDNHDRPRLWSQCDGDRQRVHDALTVLTSLRGIPSVTWGTEAESAGRSESEARSDMRFEDTPTTPILRARLAQRKASPALLAGETAFLVAQPEYLAIARVAPDEAVVVGIGERPGTPSLPPVAGTPSWEPMPSGEGSVRRWILRPGEPGGFTPWLDTLQAQRADGVSVRFVVESAPKEHTLWLVGSDPAVGAWDPENAVGPLVPGEPMIVHLPAGGVVTHKLVSRAEDGHLTWSDQPDSYTHVPPSGGEEITTLVVF